LSKNYCAELQLPVFSIMHCGRSDIDSHLETKKHKSSVKAAKSLSRVINSSKVIILMSLYSQQRKKLLLRITLLFTDSL